MACFFSGYRKPFREVEGLRWCDGPDHWPNAGAWAGVVKAETEIKTNGVSQPEGRGYTMHWPHNKQPFLITKGEGRGNGRVCTVNYTFIALPDHKFLPWLHWTELSLSSHSLFSFSCSPLPCFPREMNGKSLEYMGALDLPRFLTLNDFITLAWLLTQTPESASHQQGTPCWT